MTAPFKPSIRQRLLPALALIDQGFAIYRRNFFSLLLVGAIFLVPLVLLIGLAVWLFVERGSELGVGALILIGLVVTLLLIPLPFYLLVAVARAADQAVSGAPVSLRAALAVRPRRIAATGCFTILLTIAAQVVSSIVSFLLLCPTYALGLASASVLGVGDSSGVLSTIAIIVSGFLYLIFYALAIVIGGASSSATFYGIVPFATEDRSFGDAISHSFNLLGYRFGYNLSVWAIAGSLTTILTILAALTFAGLVPLPLYYLFGQNSTVAAIGAAVAYAIGSVVALPLLPVWMALHYRGNQTLRSGAALRTAVAAWGETSAV